MSHVARGRTESNGAKRNLHQRKRSERQWSCRRRLCSRRRCQCQSLNSRTSFPAIAFGGCSLGGADRSATQQHERTCVGDSLSSATVGGIVGRQRMPCCWINRFSHASHRQSRLQPKIDQLLLLQVFVILECCGSAAPKECPERILQIVFRSLIDHGRSNSGEDVVPK